MQLLGPGHFRFFLAMVVVLHHSTPLRLGALAVGLFFCLSGFWIAEMWAKKYRDLDRPYVEFIISRWWRLAPVTFTMVAIAAALAACGWLPDNDHAVASWKWWASQPLIAGSTWAGRLLPPTWSLDVEMQFYFVAPLVVLLLTAAPRRVAIAATAVAIAWCWFATVRGEAGEAPRLDVWIGVFAIGILSSISGWRPGRRVVIGAAAAVTAVFVLAAASHATRPWILHRGSAGPGLSGWVPATLTVITLLLAVPCAIATTRQPSGWFDRFLGDLSYPLYLFHWLPREWYYANLTPQTPVQSTLVLLAANVATALLGAVVILVLIDRPIQRARARWVRKQARRASEEPTSTKVLSPAYAATV